MWATGGLKLGWLRWRRSGRSANTLRKPKRVKPNQFESHFVKVEGKEQTKDEKAAAEATKLSQNPGEFFSQVGGLNPHATKKN